MNIVTLYQILLVIGLVVGSAVLLYAKYQQRKYKD